MSYFYIKGPVAKCSKCGSTDIEHVTYGTSEFPRCRNCKHEGEHKSLLPPQESSGAFSLSSAKQPDEVQF
jgi:hypothetical protein